MKTLSFCLALIVMSSTLAFGQTYKVLYSFNQQAGDGSGPLGNLVFDGGGNLYGTTRSGGANGGGTVFELSPNPDGTWTEKNLYNFCANISMGLCEDGLAPAAALVFDTSGNLYGTTAAGGLAPCRISNAGCGTVFELSQSQGNTWTETVLYSFCSNTNCTDGAFPTGQVIINGSGSLFGTTSSGGAANGSYGTVFKLSHNGGHWAHEILYSFCLHGHNRICPDGGTPEAGVTFDKLGNLYGTTKQGGARNSQGAGTVYELSPGANGWIHTTLLALDPESSGLENPLATVSFDPQGNLYSTAFDGVFELQTRAHTLRSFLFNIQDGAGPASGVLIDPVGRAAYGTTAGGGSFQSGVIYKITLSGQEAVLYNFCQQTDCTDGQYPYASLIQDKAGNFFGTTLDGGAHASGVVFEIMP